MVKMVANMHGNEPVGRELLVHLAKYILRFDREILETTDLYILPTMNPDGFERAFEGRCDGITYTAGRLSEGTINILYKVSAHNTLTFMVDTCQTVISKLGTTCGLLT